jgi:hypothetical protein
MEVNGKRHILASIPQERTLINIKLETGQAPGPNHTCLDIKKSPPTGIRTSLHSDRSQDTLQRQHHLEQAVPNSYVTLATYVWPPEHHASATQPMTDSLNKNMKELLVQKHISYTLSLSEGAGSSASIATEP